MIAYLKGIIRKKLNKTLVVDIGTIGYLVHVATPLFDMLEEQSNVELFIHTKVREDDISLYGFEKFSDLEFFKTLINVNGIGPKLALEIMGQNLEKVKTSIITADVAHLTKIPGIGKKTAERIIVELKGKIDQMDIDTSRTPGGIEKTVSEDAVNALSGLGYQKFEINRVLKTIPQEIKSVEEIITYFLRNV